jgi:hypothetical protein
MIKKQFYIPPFNDYLINSNRCTVVQHPRGGILEVLNLDKLSGHNKLHISYFVENPRTLSPFPYLHL